MKGKILVQCDNDGKLLKDPLIHKNIDLNFKTADQCFRNVRVLRIINSDGIAIHSLIILQEEIDENDNLVFTGLEFNDVTNSYDKAFRKYHLQEIVFTPY